MLSEKKFVINNNFQLFLVDTLVSESGFNIESSDIWFNEKYVTLHNLKTFDKFKNKGFAKCLLEQIFNYVKNTLNINIITLLVYKNNISAINLYINSGFEIYIEYEDIDAYSLIKNL